METAGQDFAIARLRSPIFGLVAALVFWPLTATMPLAQEMPDYRISAGDSLQLDFLNDEAEPYPLVVGGGGEVQVPFLGTVAIAGLTLGQARDAMSRHYVDRQILIAPQLDLSVLLLRPVSVLGDVEKPGLFDFRPGITVEQAVGLAGGPVRVAGGEEARSLQRVALRGELDGIQASMLREAVAAARLRTQLAGGTAIDVRTLEIDAIANPDNVLIASLIAQDETIILAERSYFSAERKLIDQALDDVRRQIDLTQEQIVVQTAQIQSYDAELKGTETLSDRGLITAPVFARLRRQVSDEQTALLRLRTNLAETQRLMAGLQRELLGLDFKRAQIWRQDLAESAIHTSTLTASRASLLERMALLQDWSRRGAEADATARFDYLVRRRMAEAGLATRTAVGTDELLPGDVLIVRLRRDEAERTEQTEQTGRTGRVPLVEGLPG